MENDTKWADIVKKVKKDLDYLRRDDDVDDDNSTWFLDTTKLTKTEQCHYASVVTSTPKKQ